MAVRDGLSSAWEQITAKQSITSYFLHPLDQFSCFVCAEHTSVPSRPSQSAFSRDAGGPTAGCWRIATSWPGAAGQRLPASSSSTLAPGSVPVLGSFTCLVISCRAGVGKQSSAPSRRVPALRSRLQHAACAQGWSRRCSEPAALGLTHLLLLGSTE